MNRGLAHIFNPTCEMEVANGEVSYQAPSYLQKFTQDLEILPYIYSNSEDVVLVRKLPNKDFTIRLNEAGFDLPSFCLIDKINSLKNDYKPSPWGWSPAVAKKLHLLGAKWQTELKPFFSRQFSLKILQQVTQKATKGLVDSGNVARYVEDFSQVENLMQEWKQIVIKAPFSSSGRGVQILRESYIDQHITNKTKNIIKTQGGAMVEPYYDKICDFAYEFKIGNGEISFVGFSAFFTNEQGQYEGHIIPFDANNFPKEAAELWRNGVVNDGLELLKNALQNTKIPNLYEGYFGVDALIFKDKNGDILLQPCIEINLRCNMGIVALHLEKHIAAGSTCEFKIISNKSVPLTILDKNFTAKYPLEMEDNKIVSGYLPITPPSDNAQSMVYLLVEKRS